MRNWILLYIVVVFHFSLNEGAYAQSDLAPNINADEFSREKFSEFGEEYYTLDHHGNIVSGLGQSNPDQIDYSPLVKNSILASDFLNSTIGSDNQKRPVFTWPEGKVTFHAIIESKENKLRFIFAAGSALYDVFEKSGLKSIPDQNVLSANLVIFVGSAPFLSRKARSVGDKEVAHFFERYNGTSLPESPQRDDLSVLFGGAACRVSLREREPKGKAFVFLRPEDLSTCLEKQLLLVAGLSPFRGITPSALNLNGNYSDTTVADNVFLRILYFMEYELESGYSDFASEAKDLIDLVDFEVFFY